MAFKLTQTPTFKAEVTVSIANEKGTFDKSSFHAIFKRPPTSDLKNLYENPPGDVELLNKYLTGWEMTDSDTNEAVPYNKENLAALLEISSAPQAIAQAFFDSARGARTKNSR